MYHTQNHNRKNSNRYPVAIITFILFYLSVFSVFFSCAELGKERTWSNPLDPGGSNYFPPVIILDSNVKITYPGRVLNLNAIVNDSNDTIFEYVWLLYNGTTIKDTGISSLIKITFDTSEIGLKQVSVYAKDRSGLISKTDTIYLDVRPFNPDITPVGDTTVKQDASIKILLKGTVVTGKLEYLNDSNLDGFCDSVLTDSSLTLSKPEGGSLYVHWAIRDESGVTKYDTFCIYFNKKPLEPEMIFSVKDTIITNFVDYDYGKGNGSVIVKFKVQDPDDADSTLMYELQYGRMNEDSIQIYNLHDTVTQLGNIIGSSTYQWKFTVLDPVGNSSYSRGQFTTPPSPVSPAGMKLIKSKGKKFYMGQQGYDSTAIPLHEITFTRDFWIDSAEVTCEKFSTVLQLINFPVPTKKTPVTNVTWFDAVMYCNALSKISKLDTCYIYSSITGVAGSHCQLANVSVNKSANGYRLPTEAEWEYSCRGGKSTIFFWGNDQVMITQYAWTSANGNSVIHDIASLKPNPFGIYDLAGNAWEWCNDWFDKNYYRVSAKTDPFGPSTGTEQVIRGGSASSHYYFSQSGTRSKLRPDQYNQYTGFRTVLVIQ
jgi:formylglycine-generating enzyme required for sulfatase activity